MVAAVLVVAHSAAVCAGRICINRNKHCLDLEYSLPPHLVRIARKADLGRDFMVCIEFR